VAKSAWVFDVAEAGFDREVVQKSRETPVVVDFWAPWCGPCRMLGPLLERLVDERGGAVALAKVNIDEEQGLAYQFGIQSIPAVIAFRDGRPVLDFVGLLPEPQLRDFLDRVLPSEADRTTQQAASLEATNPAEAERLYRQSLAQDRNQDSAVVGLARLLVQAGKDTEARELLANAAPSEQLAQEAERLNGILSLRELARPFGNEQAARQRAAAQPRDAEMLYQLGAVLGAVEKYPQALETLLAAAELDPKLAASRIREAMVQIFHIVGVRSSLADEYRNKLSALLY
jgi:putative thioredoxin